MFSFLSYDVALFAKSSVLNMKKYCLFFMCLFITAVIVPAYSDVKNISGEWVYHPDYNGVGGTMKIKDCINNKCKIEFNTYNGAHTCELDDTILNLGRKSAVATIKDEYSGNDCEITITTKSDNVINVSDNKNCNFLCGMSGVFTGRWQNTRAPLMYSAGFDCERATTDVELMICRDKDLAQYDSEVNALYKVSSGQKSTQKKWLRLRNQCQTDVKCLTEQYDSRLRELVSLITKAEFNLFDYARLISDDGWFFPNQAILISNFIKNKIGDDEYEKFISCSNRATKNIFNENEIFAGYGCPGLFTIMESAIYIDKNHIWISYLDDDEIVTYAPQNNMLQTVPLPLSEWLQDLKKRTKDNIISEKVVNKL